jgi:hypothetical protein
MQPGDHGVAKSSSFGELEKTAGLVEMPVLSREKEESE